MPCAIACGIEIVRRHDAEGRHLLDMRMAVDAPGQDQLAARIDLATAFCE
jgi:hypothetical protein